MQSTTAAASSDRTVASVGSMNQAGALENSNSVGLELPLQTTCAKEQDVIPDDWWRRRRRRAQATEGCELIDTVSVSAIGYAAIGYVRAGPRARHTEMAVPTSKAACTPVLLVVTRCDPTAEPRRQT